MKCTNCGADFPSDQLKCPYCNAVNEHALKLAKEIQQYDKEFAKTRDEMLSTGGSAVIKRLTIQLGVSFLVIALIFIGYVMFYQYRYGESTKYHVTGNRYKKNLKLVEQYMNDKEYLRAYTLAASTDPTHEYFTYYSDYKDELTAIYNYSLILTGILRAQEDLAAGDNYESLTGSTLISLEIFYNSPDCAVKEELALEIESYLKNHYRLTPEEIQAFKACESYQDFTIDGSSDIETITKERMVAYYGK